MDKFFALLGKILVGAGIIGILIGGGYYLGTRHSSQNTSQKTVLKISPTQIPTVTAAASPTNAQATGRFAVIAGGILPFASYSLSGVAGWIPKKTIAADVNVLTLVKGKYAVTISQGAAGASPCVFPGDKAQDMSVVLTSSQMIPLLSGTPLRRGQSTSANTGETSFLVCQKKSDGSYNTFTDFGFISYTAPLNPDSSILAEMDAMVGSLQKK